MSEQWLPIPGFAGRYEVSDQGRVRSMWRHGLVLKVHPNARDGYMQVQLRRPDKSKMSNYIHRLVLRAFLGPRPEGMVARHLNGNKKDNRLKNLAWGTQSENNYDQVAHGTHSLAARTHCKHGHEFTPENTGYREGRSGRVCKECRRQYEEGRRRPVTTLAAAGS